MKGTWKHAGCAAVLAALWACGGRLPELPRIETGSMQAEVRKVVERAAEEARANATDADRVMRLGAALHAHDQFAAAAQAYSRAHAIEPRRYDALYLWGQALAAGGDYGRAAERLRRAIARRPRSIPARLKLAEILLESGNTSESGEIARRVLEEDPDNAAAHYALGRALAGDAAMEEFRRALAVFPRYGAAQFALAAAYRRAGEAAKARDALRDYERDKIVIPPLNDPEMAAMRALNASATGLLSQAQELDKEGRLREALELHLRAVAMEPSLAQAWVNLISIHGRLQRDDEAERAFRKAIDLEPNRADAYYNFGVFCFDRRRLDDARQAFQQAVRLDPRHAEALNNLGAIVEQEGRWDEAAALYRRAVEARPSYPLAHFHLGRIYANQRKYSQAIAAFEKSLEPVTDATPAHLYALAATHARAGNRPRAVELMRQARQQAASNGQAALAKSIDRDLAALGARP